MKTITLAGLEAWAQRARRDDGYLDEVKAAATKITDTHISWGNEVFARLRKKHERAARPIRRAPAAPAPRGNAS